MLRRENIFRVCLKSHWRNVIVWCRIAEKFFAGKFVQVYKIIAFDFDGTLVDSVDFYLSVFDLVFAKFMGELRTGKMFIKTSG